MVHYNTYHSISTSEIILQRQIVLIFVIWIYQVITTLIIYLSYIVYKTIKLQVQSLFVFYNFPVDKRKVL